MTHETDGKLHQNVAYAVMKARLDIDGYRREYKAMPPAMFINSAAMDEWIWDMAARPRHPPVVIEKSKLGNFNDDDVVRLTAKNSIVYDTLWVKQRFKDYRAAMSAFLVARDDASASALHTVDGDHVINKSRAHPDSWLMLMAVPKSSNRGFGAAIESQLPALAVDMALIEPFLLLKIFMVDKIRNLGELAAAAKALGGQMQDGDGKQSVIEEAVEEYRALRGWELDAAAKSQP